MRTVYPTLVLKSGSSNHLQELLGNHYELLSVESSDDVFVHPRIRDIKMLLIDMEFLGPPATLKYCRRLKEQASTSDLPVILLAASPASLEYRMKAYELGCDDYISTDEMNELMLRVNRVLFNKVASDQLRVQLQQAHEMAFIAMSDTSDLGVNVQFLLDCNSCENLDELGMRLFQALQNYGLNCSLQMRSRFSVKNMEANGMAKELESTLLTECRNQGRYVDFGKRSIMNYGCVSLLVKNMPLEDSKKYGAIKDNVFSLLQGAHARVEALDNRYSLEVESQVVKQLAMTMRELMSSVDRSYHKVMLDIVDVVEELAGGIEHSVQFLGMDEYQEKAIQNLTETAIQDTNRVFNRGLRIDDGLGPVLDRIDTLMAAGNADPNELKRLLDSLSKVGK